MDGGSQRDGLLNGKFPPTRWSLLERIRSPEHGEAERALAEICRCYWFPIYGFIRQWGHRKEDAEDLTQDFLVRLMQRETLCKVAAENGRLRTFLLVLLKRFLADDHDWRQAVKRGGRAVLVPIDGDWAEERLESGSNSRGAPETHFDRSWALTLLDEVLRALRSEYERSGKEAHFDALKGTLTTITGQRPYAEVAPMLGMSPNGVKVAVHRLRQRYRQLLHQRILLTVSSPEEVEDEIRYLCELLGNP